MATKRDRNERKVGRTRDFFSFALSSFRESLVRCRLFLRCCLCTLLFDIRLLFSSFWCHCCWVHWKKCAGEIWCIISVFGVMNNSMFICCPRGHTVNDHRAIVEAAACSWFISRISLFRILRGKFRLFTGLINGTLIGIFNTS